MQGMSFSQQRRERNDKIGSLIVIGCMVYVAFMGGQAYQSVRDPQKEHCLMALGKVEYMMESASNSPGMKLPVKKVSIREVSSK